MFSWQRSVSASENVRASAALSPARGREDAHARDGLARVGRAARRRQREGRVAVGERGTERDGRAARERRQQAVAGFLQQDGGRIGRDAQEVERGLGRAGCEYPDRAPRRGLERGLDGVDDAQRRCTHASPVVAVGEEHGDPRAARPYGQVEVAADDVPRRVPRAGLDGHAHAAHEPVEHDHVGPERHEHAVVRRVVDHAEHDAGVPGARPFLAEPEPHAKGRVAPRRVPPAAGQRAPQHGAAVRGAHGAERRRSLRDAPVAHGGVHPGRGGGLGGGLGGE